MNITTTTMAALCTLAAAMLPSFAAAQELEVKCEVRSDRSRASIDGRNLASGNYYSVLISGGDSVTSKSTLHTIGDEVEFDFDSNNRDVRQGATKISQDFIVNRRVVGQLYTASGNLVVQRSQRCERK